MNLLMIIVQYHFQNQTMIRMKKKVKFIKCIIKIYKEECELIYTFQEEFEEFFQRLKDGAIRKSTGYDKFFFTIIKL